MTAEGMAKVLAEHRHGFRINSKERWTECLCEVHVPWLPHEDEVEHDDSLNAHVADALVAAGYGDVREAERSAHDEGCRADALALQVRTLHRDVATQADALLAMGETVVKAERERDEATSRQAEAVAMTARYAAASKWYHEWWTAESNRSHAAEAKTADILADLKALADELGEPDSWNSLSEDSFPHVINRINALIAKHETGGAS